VVRTAVGFPSDDEWRRELLRKIWPQQGLVTSPLLESVRQAMRLRAFAESLQVPTFEWPSPIQAELFQSLSDVVSTAVGVDFEALVAPVLSDWLEATQRQLRLQVDWEELAEVLRRVERRIEALRDEESPSDLAGEESPPSEWSKLGVYERSVILIMLAQVLLNVILLLRSDVAGEISVHIDEITIGRIEVTSEADPEELEETLERVVANLVEVATEEAATRAEGADSEEGGGEVESDADEGGAESVRSDEEE
jgi:hypothetical protein